MRAGLHPEWPASTRRLGSYTVLGFVLGWRTLPVDCSALLHPSVADTQAVVIGVVHRV